MKLGVVFPTIEIGSDPAAIREYAQAAEELGYDHIIAYDHVLGTNPASRPGWRGPYTIKHAFHEPFVLFGYLAAVTKRVELATGVIVLPQRQAVLVAKQAAEVDVLSGGRLRLGIGIGWNEVEYEALGEDFHTRGRRCEEQISVLRALWSQDAVTFQGLWHRIPDAGIRPLPLRGSIPIWIGGAAEPVLKRIARLGDGWFPLSRPDEAARKTVARLHGYVREAGRDPGSIGIEGILSLNVLGPDAADAWSREVEAWRQLGATHVAVNTMRAQFDSPAQHIEAIRRFKQVVGG